MPYGTILTKNILNGLICIFSMTYDRVVYYKNNNFYALYFTSGWCQDENTSTSMITGVKHIELNQFSDG